MPWVLRLSGISAPAAPADPWSSVGRGSLVALVLCCPVLVLLLISGRSVFSG
jgi:hypothetical protein